MINFNKENLNFRYQPEREGKVEKSQKGSQKASVFYKLLNAQGQVTQETHARINDIFTIIDKKLVSLDIDLDRSIHHNLVVQHLTSDTFLIKIDNKTAFKLSLNDEEIVSLPQAKVYVRPLNENCDIARPFSKPLPLSTNLLSGIDDKRLAFSQGDSFIMRSGLEGGDTTSNLQYLMASIESNKNLAGKLDLAPLQECLQRETRERPTFNAGSANAHQIYHRQMKAYANKLAKQVKVLEVGKKLILSGGWASTSSGHAMIYIIEKDDSNTCSFTILNTGAGLNYHHSQRVGLKQNYRPVVRLNHIDVQLLTTPDFFEALLELQISSKPKGNSWEHDSKEIYERIVPALQGRRDSAFEENFSLITKQRSGTCAWKVLMKLIQVLVESDSKSSEPYKKFVFDLRRDSLTAYFNRIVNGELDITDERLMLLKLSTENFARFAIKQHQAGLITDSELSEIKSSSHIILGEIRRFTSFANVVSPLNFKSTNFSFKSNDNTAGKLPEVIFKEHTPCKWVIDERSRAATISQIPSFETLPATAQEFNALLQKVIVSCKELLSQDSPRILMQMVIALIKAIPPNSLQSGGYWGKLSANATKEEVGKTICLINEASQLYFSGIAFIPEAERGTPDQYAAQMILLAVTDKLVKTLDYPFIQSRIPEEDWNLNCYAIVNDSQLRQYVFESRKSILKGFRDGKNRITTEYTLKFQLGKHLYGYTIFDAFYAQPDFKEKVVDKWPELKDRSDYLIFKKLFKEVIKDFQREIPLTSDLFPPYIFAQMAQQSRLYYFDRNPHLQHIRFDKKDTPGKLNFELQLQDNKLTLLSKLTGVETLDKHGEGSLFKFRPAYASESDK